MGTKVYSAHEFKSALSHPHLLLSYLIHTYKIADLTGCPINMVRCVLREKELEDISKHVVRELGMHRKLILGPGSKPRKAEVLYTIVRLIKPLIIVETGVQSGISSAFILKALEKNGRGVLYSIDLPDESLIRIIPATKRHNLVSGWVIPAELKQRWHLILGKSKEKLIPLLSSLKEIDIFFMIANIHMKTLCGNIEWLSVI
jgi:hypothetical protein